MKPSLEKRLASIEAALAIGPAVHWIWDDDNTDVEAEIAARIAAGTAKPGDVFRTVGWLPAGGPEVPIMGADRYQ